MKKETKKKRINKEQEQLKNKGKTHLAKLNLYKFKYK